MECNNSSMFSWNSVPFSRGGVITPHIEQWMRFIANVLIAVGLCCLRKSLRLLTFAVKPCAFYTDSCKVFFVKHHPTSVQSLGKPKANFWCYCSETWALWCLKIASNSTVQQLLQANNKENFKVPRYCSFVKSSVSQRASNADSVLMSWRLLGGTV